jgi:carboxyl-terminal processing protease
MKHLIFKIALFGFMLNSLANTQPQGKQKVDINFYNAVKILASQGYVDEVNEEEFIYNSLNGGLSGVDTHSGYLKPQEYRKLKESFSGEFGGIGVQIITENGFIKVVSPIEETPAFKAGLKSGDYITHINGEITYQASVEEASSKLRGKEGTQVKITVLREGAKEPLEFALKREKIKSKSVSSKEFNDILIIRIFNFTNTTASEIRELILSRKTQAKGIILDLRNNPGGILDQSIAVSNFFLSGGKRIVSTKMKYKFEDSKQESKIACDAVGFCETVIEEKKGNETIFYSTAKTLIPESIPMVILINGSSASASEIVAGALKDNKRAITIGELSFGKGVVQSIIPIPSPNGENGAIKLTISRYYSPNGTSIQTAGITPEITVLNAKVALHENKFQNLFAQREEDLKNHTIGEKLEEIAKQSQKYSKSKEDIKSYYEDFQMTTAINIIQALMIKP